MPANPKRRQLDQDKKFRLLFEDNPQPMWVLDPETHRFLEANAAASALYGYQQDEFRRMKLEDIRASESSLPVSEPLSKPVSSAPAVWRHRTHDGRTIEVEIASHEIDYRGTKAQLSIVMDVTGRRQLEEQLIPIVRLAADLDAHAAQDKIFSTKRFDSGVADRIRQVGVLRSQGAYSKSLEAMNQLPGLLADTLAMQEMRAKDARRANDLKEYYRVLGAIELRYGSDRAVWLTLADYYIQNDEVSKALAGLESLESRIGVDGGIYLMRAHMLLEAKNYSESLTSARKAVDLEPGLQGAWYCLARSYVELKNYPEAVATYQAVQARFHTAFTRKAFGSDPEFAAFAESAAFQKWLPQ